MAENSVTADGNRKHIRMRSPRSPYSRPVQFREVELFSMQAQRLAERALDKVAYSLFSLEVILQIIGQREMVDEVEKMISDEIASADEELLSERERLKKLQHAAGITSENTPHYTNPANLTLEITSPLIMNFVKLLKKLDVVMVHIDTLWMNGELSNQQRVNANHKWHQRLQRLSSRIITFETRARKQANRLGKEQEVAKEAPKQVGADKADEEGDTGDEATSESNATERDDAEDDGEKDTDSASQASPAPATAAATAST